MSQKICCPKCGSDQITAEKKGFSGKKAVAGAVLTGGIGLLAGTIGSNKIKIYCLACGHSWLPSDLPQKHTLSDEELKAAKSTAFSSLYRSAQYEKAKDVYRDIHGLSESADVNDMQLKSFNDSVVSKQNFGFIIMGIILIIILLFVVKLLFL